MSHKTFAEMRTVYAKIPLQPDGSSCGLYLIQCVVSESRDSRLTKASFILCCLSLFTESPQVPQKGASDVQVAH